MEDEPIARRFPPLPTSTTCQQLPTKEAASDSKRTLPSTIEVNLDGASRSTIVAAACVCMQSAGARGGDLGEWRQRASEWDLPELLHRAAECGVRYRRGNRPWSLPQQAGH